MTKKELSKTEEATMLAALATKEVLTFDEACMYTGLTPSCMYKLTSAKKIAHYKPNGKMIYFKRDELSSWLLQGRVSTSEEIAMQTISYTMNRKAAH